uniref:Uncharacterized protein n=1 Tax=Xiphophorus couchianus TaxID=32473 RepID=A0A3B5LC96_9TELE
MMASVVVGGNRKKSLTLRGVDPETLFLTPVVPGGAMGPILEFVVLEGVMERLFLWSLRRQFTEDMKLEQLRMYQMLLSQAKQPLLHHKPVLRPLMMLLTSCAGAELVQLLNQLCVALVKDPSVLELFFHTSQDQGAANFLLFSLLIPYTHRQGLVGQQARDALLLIMSLSASEPRVAQHIAENTYFCPVLATGLSGLYSSLPARLQVYSEDWHSLESADWQQVPALVHFLHSLDFCSAVTKVAHPSIRSQLLSYIYNGFLVPVLAPALHKLTVEEVMTTTAYLDLFLRSISEPALLQNFLSFILLHRHDNVHILDTLVSRLGTVSLALFRTLIGLFCEDVMLQLVFRYLIPCSHLSRKQRCSLNQRDCYSSSAASFLLLLPSWCPMYLNNRHSLSEHIHWPKAAGKVLEYFMHPECFVSRACRFWSAPYDGFDPPPQEYRSDTPGDDLEDEDEFIQRTKSDSICSLVVLRPVSALSPTPSSSDTVSTSNLAGRASSAMEMEWDDIFAEEDLSSSSAIFNVSNGFVESDGCSFSPVPPPPLPPRHIQEMRLTATKLVRGAYVEESEFQDDVIVYDLVAQKDTTTALFERIKAANRQSRESFSKSGRTVMETVNSIMSTRRRSEDGGKEEGRKSVECDRSARRKSEGFGTKEKEDGELHVVLNGFDVKNLIISEFDDSDQETESFAQNCIQNDIPAFNGHNQPTHETGVTPSPETNNLTNGHLEPEPLRISTTNTQNSIPPANRISKNDFLSQYYELMLSLGVEPDGDDITDDVGTFRRRVRALRQKLAEEEEQLVSEFGFSSSWDEAEQEGEVEAMEEEEEEEEEKSGNMRGGPFTGLCLQDGN